MRWSEKAREHGGAEWMLVHRHQQDQEDRRRVESDGMRNGCRGKRRRCGAAGRTGMLRCEKARERRSMISAAGEGGRVVGSDGQRSGV